MNGQKEDNGAGCFILVGIIILSIVAGSTYGYLSGWGTLGVGLVLLGLLAAGLDTRS